MAVDNLLGSAPLTLTRQIIDLTNQQIQQVRETVEEILLEGGDKTEKSVARPQTQPVGSAQSSAEDGALGQGGSDGSNDDGNTTPSRGNVVNARA